MKESLRKTREKRKSQDCKVFELKIVKDKLFSETLNQLNKLFIEAKQYYNWILSHENIFSIDTKIKEITVFNKKTEETKKVIVSLPAKVRGDLKKRIITAIKSLSTKKKKGKQEEVGKLKFKSFVNSIPLDNQAWRFITPNKIYIVKIKQYLKVMGVDQIPKNAEFANANLVKKNGDFYLYITVFLPKEEKLSHEKSIGIDFGCDKPLTLSNGIQIQYNIPVDRKIKKLHRKFSRQQKHSKNKQKTIIKLNKAYDKKNHQKKDINKKILNILGNNYKIAIQDENIKGWQKGGHGKKINQTAIGGLISGIKKLPGTVIVDRFFPSTKTCSRCGHVQKVELFERVFTCKNCGLVINRDLNSAVNLDNQVPQDMGKLKPVETKSSTLKIMERLNVIPFVKASLVNEIGTVISRKRSQLVKAN